MHSVLNKELNKDVIDLQRKMYQENYQNTRKQRNAFVIYWFTRLDQGEERSVWR